MTDIEIQDEGTIAIFWPRTDAGRSWLEREVVQDDTQFWGQDGIVVEHRFVETIAVGAINDGLEVSLG